MKAWIEWIQSMLNAHVTASILTIWVVWGLACMGLAHTELVTWPSFTGFRDAMKAIIPSVNYIPPAEAIDPLVSSSFLALIWGSSPMAWILFSRVPAEKLIPKAAWNAPTTTRIRWVMVVLGICAVTAFFIDFGSRRPLNLLLARDVCRFSILASLVAAFPWYAIVIETGWIKRVRETSIHSIRE